MIDPVTLQVIREGLVALCRSMGHALSRTAYSPIFSEGFDLSCPVRRTARCGQAEFTRSISDSNAYTVEWTVKEIGLDNLDEGASSCTTTPRGRHH